MALLLAIPTQTALTTSFMIQPSDVTGTQIAFQADTMPGNQPNTYANTAYIWQTSSQQVPINTTPLNTMAIPQNQPNFSAIFMGLNVTEEAYLVAFATAASTSSIVSTVLIPATGGSPANPNSANSSITVTGVGSTSVSFSYVTPPGMQPQTNLDWIGLWQGQGESALYTVAPTWFGPMGTNSFQGNWGLNISSGGIQRGTMYTIGYFKGGYAATSPKQTTLSCCSTFFG